MQHLIINDKLHNTIKFYCMVKKIKVQDYVEKVFLERQELIDFKNNLEELKVK